jgi:hopene-associated glycosyltransferase HpnB
MVFEVIAALSLAIWLYLVFARGGFWLCTERDDTAEATSMPTWPAVTAVVPARNEAAGIGECVGSLLRQGYPGAFALIVVDDDSIDGTALAARATAAAQHSSDRLTVIEGRPLPTGWTGKVWAVKQGIEAAQDMSAAPDYLLLTDADIAYEPGVLARLVSRAVNEQRVLTSLMVRLRCESFAERSLIPAFIFFFQMLYPFSWVNRTDHTMAAAAGGCMLVRADALRQAGGIEAIRGTLIDDCALAGILKEHGPIWLGVTEHVRSTRPYPSFDDIRQMVARSAYAQLNYSPIVLAGTIAGMALTYLAPPLLAVFTGGIAQLLGLAAWALMAIAFQPTLRLYRLSPLWGLALPAIAVCYMLFTLDSALQFARGRGGLWKGRIQATRS